jgi:putative DNA primase/helicase
MENKVVQSLVLYPEIIETKKSIKVLDTYKNLEWLLKHFKADIRYNLMTRKREIEIPEFFIFPDDIENSALAKIDYLATVNEMPTKKLDQHLDTIGGENAYHPIVNCIKAKEWDKKERLSDFIKTINSTNNELAFKIIHTWMMAAIAAAHSVDGFVNHGVLVLQGAQGIGKTAWVKSLDPINCNAVKEGAILDPTNKDSIISLASHWIVELGEIDATFRKADVSRLKSFITTQADDVRMPYARRSMRLVRRTAYVATVNDEKFLTDDTGNRRWWTIQVKSINYDHGFNMQQVWAEAYHDWKVKGALTYLPTELQQAVNESNREHEKLDPLVEKVLTIFDWASPGRRELTVTEILNEMDYSKPTKNDLISMSKILTELNHKGCRKSNGLRLHEIPFRKYPTNFN